MKLINDSNLLLDPVNLKFAYATIANFPGFYHAHQGIEFLYIHSGKGDVLVNHKIYTIRDHTCVFYQPYQLHRIRMDVSPTSPFIRSKFLFEPSFLDEKLSFAPNLQTFFRRLWKHEVVQPVIYDVNHNRQLVSLMDEFQNRVKKLHASEKQEESLLFLVEFIHLLKLSWSTHLFGENPNSREREHHHSEIMIQWLENHLEESFVLDRMAHDLHLSKHHLSRLFKRSTGSTLTEYLTIIRIQKACRLLETSEKSIEQISLSVGISNISYFCEIFKKTMGSTPLQYRLSLTNSQ